MKKLLCFLLAITLITSVSMIGVNAEENERFTTYKTNWKALIYVDTETNYEYEYLTTGNNSDGSEFILLNWFGNVSDAVYYQTLGDYVLFNPHLVGSEGPYFIIKDNEVYGVTEAIENGLIEGTALYNAMQNTTHKKRIKLLGDTNDDGILNIMDATFIQAKLAEGETYYNKYSTKLNYLADYNADGFVNVVDATEIQKALAEIN